MDGPLVMTKVKLNLTLSRRMKISERRYWYKLAGTIDEHFIDTLPKQEALLDYVRARNELEDLQLGYQHALKTAAKEPDDDKNINRLTKWSQMINKTESKIERLRSSIGLNAKYEAQLKKAKRVKSSPKGGLEIKPWDRV